MNLYVHSILYSRARISVGWQRLHDEDAQLSRGASAIEWAIITGLLAVVAAVAFVAIKTAVENAAEKASTQVENAGNEGGGG
ncbi:hypothetical protein GCM10027589_52080 [Actinocorallia lasiicapitis]